MERLINQTLTKGLVEIFHSLFKNITTVTWSHTERGEVGDYYYSSVFELTGQGLTVERGI